MACLETERIRKSYTFIPFGGRKTFPGKENLHLKIVTAFSLQSLRPDTRVLPPPCGSPFIKRPVRNTLFRKYFLRGDIPVTIKKSSKKHNKKQENGKTTNLEWNIPISQLDYSYYLPIFFDGLAEIEDPYKTLVRSCIHELIEGGKDKILPVIPQLIMPMKQAFNTNIPDVIVATLKIIQRMVIAGPCVGQALVPYYRQLLPICNLFKTINVNLGDGIDHNRDNRIGDVIEDTLAILEKCGGPDAYINIKYMIPTYESYVLN